MNLQTIPNVSDYRLLQASGEIQYEFEELGFEILSGFDAGSFNGKARVTYWNDEEEGLSWFVHDIYLDCVKWNGMTYEHRLIEIEPHQKLYLDLWGALTDGPAKDSIDKEIRQRL